MYASFICCLIVLVVNFDVKHVLGTGENRLLSFLFFSRASYVNLDFDCWRRPLFIYI